MQGSEEPLDGLFGGDAELLAIPRLGEAWETAERSVSARLSADCGLRLSDLLALDRIQRGGRGGIRTNALARALRIPSNRLTYQLSGLEKRGYIDREPHPDDGRGVILRLTRSGRDAHKRALAAYRRITRGGLASLDSGQDGPRIMAAAAVLAGDGAAPDGVDDLLDALGASSVDEALAMVRGRGARATPRRAASRTAGTR